MLITKIFCEREAKERKGKRQRKEKKAKLCIISCCMERDGRERNKRKKRDGKKLPCEGRKSGMEQEITSFHLKLITYS